MSTWTAPATWANSAVTAAQMNTEIRDHLNFLKGFADLISNSTTADTSNTTYLRILRSAIDLPVLQGMVTADTSPRIVIESNGDINWSSGAAAADTVLYRSAADTLKTDDRFDVGTSISLGGTLQGVIEISERSDPGVASTNNARIWVQDNGAGKTRLMVTFQSGSGIVLATEV